MALDLGAWQPLCRSHIGHCVGSEAAVGWREEGCYPVGCNYVFSRKPDEKCFEVKVYLNRSDKTHFINHVVITGGDGQDINRTGRVRSTNKNKKRDYIAHVLFIHDTTDCISRPLKKKKIGIHTVQKLFNKMASCFRPTKNRRLLTQEPGVCKIPWSCGKVYVSQMSCHISTKSYDVSRDPRLGNQ
jgi:hypothetical protein